MALAEVETPGNRASAKTFKDQCSLLDHAVDAILGAVLFLRMGYAVAHVGLIGAIQGHHPQSSGPSPRRSRSPRSPPTNASRAAASTSCSRAPLACASVGPSASRCTSRRPSASPFM